MPNILRKGFAGAIKSLVAQNLETVALNHKVTHNIQTSTTELTEAAGEDPEYAELASSGPFAT